MTQLLHEIPETARSHDATIDAWGAAQLYLKDRMMAVNEVIMTRLQSRAPLIPEVAAHLIAAGGKRIRPALLLLAGQLFQYTGERDIGLAACIEFIHTATLLHDDVVDLSTERRGAKTAHLIWGNASSILVGDFLFSKAFEFMVADGSLEVLDLLSKAASQIAEGEVLQLVHGQDLSLDEATYFLIIESKTAALFRAATRIGGVIGAATPAQGEALAQFGLHFGMMFQLIDDWLDYGADAAQLNKQMGDDFREGKVTYPLLMAVRRASLQERMQLDGYREVQHRSTPNAFAWTQDLMRRTGALQATRDLAAYHGAQALKVLEELPVGPARDVLGDLVAASLARQY